jgi:integral membrane sensor domain MASE1
VQSVPLMFKGKPQAVSKKISFHNQEYEALFCLVTSQLYPSKLLSCLDLLYFFSYYMLPLLILQGAGGI